MCYLVRAKTYRGNIYHRRQGSERFANIHEVMHVMLYTKRFRTHEQHTIYHDLAQRAKWWCVGANL